MVSFKGAHFVKDMILTCVRRYVAYPLSYRQVEELMQERGMSVDHVAFNRRVVKYSPQLEATFHRRKRPVWLSWRMDETYIKVKGQWRSLYRALDKSGQTIDFLLTRGFNEAHGTAIIIRPVKWLNNIVEPDHRGVKRITRPMLGFKSCDAAQWTLAGIELMHMLRKGQLEGGVEQGRMPAAQFYAPVAASPDEQASPHPH